MSPLETTLIQQAREHLAALRDIIAVPPDERGGILEFTGADARLGALLALGHLPQSGMHETVCRMLLDLERERSTLLCSQPEGAPPP